MTNSSLLLDHKNRLWIVFGYIPSKDVVTDDVYFIENLGHAKVKGTVTLCPGTYRMQYLNREHRTIIDSYEHKQHKFYFNNNPEPEPRCGHYSTLYNAIEHY